MEQDRKVREIRKHARALICTAFISSLRNVENLHHLDESVERIRQTVCRPKPPPTQRSIDEHCSTSSPPSSTIFSQEQPWTPQIDGRKTIQTMIDSIWNIPYAPCRYVIQFMCTVQLARMSRHKFCVRWTNNRRSAIFYVNIDENQQNISVWIHFPGEIKAHRPHTSHSHFQRFLLRNLF
ncbi:unnamed protein product [Caenorhabditis angaria]|uniref:Uncharacterized protein n=1 Tax=Caenorhabditis angaria TaxID=860376 RepID=A0A9P1IBY4_9PELO|nr:unnamed protein product [Caenorhabditis angaria]